MYNIIRRIYSSFFILLLNYVFAQEVNDYNDFTPSIFHNSPNVSQMKLYMDQGINHSNGGQNISIPIYTIKDGNITLPITINYTANGIKVDQEATNVGLGWSLNYGGLVTREIRSIIDDCKLHNNFGGVIYSTTHLEDIYNLPLWQLNQLNESREIDNELDLFSYNIGNSSGEFIFDQNSNKFIELEKSLNKIEFKAVTSNGRIHEFTITDSNGTKYIFGNTLPNLGGNYVETNNRMVYGSNFINPATYPEPIGATSWYIRKIEDIMGNSITFEYLKNFDVEYYNRIPEISHKGIMGLNSIYTKSVVNEIVISKIKFKNGEINFNYDLNRDDLKNSKGLKSIEINEKLENSNFPTLIQKYELQHSYFDYEIKQGPSHPNADLNLKRLKLNKVLIKDIISNVINDYQFEYDHTPLPPKFSNSKDYWGGYNGVNNSRLVPPVTIINTNLGGFLDARVPLLDKDIERNVDKDYVAAGMLTKIKYPTGGYTKYYYEPNTISDFVYLDEFNILPEYLHVKNVKNPYKLKEFKFTSNANFPGYQLCTKEEISPYIYNINCQFTIENELQSSILLKDILNISCPSGAVTDWDFDSYPPYDDGGVCIFREPKLKNLDGTPMENWITAQPGSYILSVRYNGNPEFLTNNTAWFWTDFKVKVDESPDIRVVGGLRVYKVENYESDGKLASLKEYTYEFDDFSSGKGILPKFAIYQSYMIGNLIDYFQEDKQIFYMSDSNLNPFANGNVSYAKVKETFKNINDSSSYSKLYTFSNSIYRYNVLYIRPSEFFLNNYSYMDTKWNSKLDFEESLGLNSTVSLISNTNILEQNTAKTIFSGSRVIDLGMSMEDKIISGRYIIDYHHFSSYSRLHKVENLEKFENGEITNSINYKFLGDNPLLISETSTNNSLGETIKTTYEYPQDLPTKPQANALILANRISEPLVVKTFNGSTQLSEQETEYAYFSGKILPKFVYSKKGGGITSADKRITYDEYDEKGNLLQYRLENGIPVSIIWGYNGQYPIAKIEGANYTQVSPFVNALQTASNDGSLSVTSFNGLRASLSDSMVTGYVYKPLIGVTAIVQPNGLSETYHYDSAGRLEYVKDHNGSILKKIDYNYKD